MKEKTLFREFEKKTFQLHFKDGIFELLFGGMFIIYVINSYAESIGRENPLLIRLLIVPLTLILVTIKMFITNPRVGYVKFSKTRRKKQKWLLVVGVFAQVIPLIAYIMSVKGIIQTEQKNQFLSLFIEFAFLIIVFGLITFYTDYILFFITGLIYAFGVPFSKFLEPWLHTRNYGYGLISLAGLVFLSYGFYKLIIFLKKYPKAKTDEL